MMKKFLVGGALLVVINLLFTIPSSARIALDETARVGTADAASPASQTASSVSWQSPAKLRRGLSRVPGTLVFDATGVEFRPNKGNPVRWPFVEIKTIYVAPRKVTLSSYERRGCFRLGTRDFNFELGEEMPASVSAALARELSRPIRNANPGEQTTGTVSIPVHHNTLRGGSNGVLRFSDDGIDYVTQAPEDSRSWEWRDIQTVSYPDAYHFTVYGFLETYSFDLKHSLPAGIYDHATDEIFKHSETGVRGASGKSTQGLGTNAE